MTKSEEQDIFKAIEILVSSLAEIRNFWDNYLKEEYQNGEFLHDRSYFNDLSAIARYLVDKYKKNETNEFAKLFVILEHILSTFDENTCSIITVGLFESIQTYKELDFYHGFDQWLKPVTKKWWDSSIDYSFGIDWKKQNG